MAFEHLGVRFGIRADSPDLIGLAASRLPPGATVLETDQIDVLLSLPGGTPAPRTLRRYLILYDGISRVARTLDRDALSDALDSAIHVALAERAKDWLFVHAGVVGWRDRAVIIPGASLSGKTSLVAALLKAGATFYSDDRAVIDAAGRVHPYPRPLSIRESPTARQCPVPASSFGAPTGERPLTVGLIALTRYQEGATWTPDILPRSRAVLAMIEHTSAMRTRPREALATLRRVVAGASTVTGRRGDAAETAARLLALV